MAIPMTQMVDILKQGLTDSLQATVQKAAVDAFTAMTRGAIPSNTHQWDDIVANKVFTAEEISHILTLKSRMQSLLSREDLPTTVKNIIHHKVANNFIVAGGCFNSILQNQTPNDYDMFMLGYTHEGIASNPPLIEELDRMSSDVRNGEFPNRFISFDHSGYKMNPNILRTYLDTKTRIQYIFTSYMTRKELIDHFDFLHCGVSYDIGSDRLYITREMYDLNVKKILKKSLTANHINPHRIEKFLNRGWSMNV